MAITIGLFIAMKTFKSLPLAKVRQIINHQIFSTIYYLFWICASLFHTRYMRVRLTQGDLWTIMLVSAHSDTSKRTLQDLI